MWDEASLRTRSVNVSDDFQYQLISLMSISSRKKAELGPEIHGASSVRGESNDGAGMADSPTRKLSVPTSGMTRTLCSKRQTKMT